MYASPVTVEEKTAEGAKYTDLPVIHRSVDDQLTNVQTNKQTKPKTWDSHKRNHSVLDLPKLHKRHDPNKA